MGASQEFTTLDFKAIKIPAEHYLCQTSILLQEQLDALPGFSFWILPLKPFQCRGSQLLQHSPLLSQQDHKKKPALKSVPWTSK